MTTEQYAMAAQIWREIEGIRSELASWEYAGAERIGEPLNFRMAGALKHMPPGAFESFRVACITGMKHRIEELEGEFGRL